MNKTLFERWLLLFFGLIVVTYFFRISMAFILYGAPHSLMVYLYFYGIKITPLIFFALYLYYKQSDVVRFKRGVRNMYLFFIGIVGPFLLFLIYGVLVGRSFYSWTGLNWSYHAAFEWSLAVLACFVLWIRKNPDVITAFSFAFLSMHAAGFLYELPLVVQWIAPNSGYDFFNSWHPLYITTKVIAPFLLGYMLYRERWKPNPLFYIALPGYIAFSILWFFTPRQWVNWIPRLPAIFLMLTLPLSKMEVKQ